MKEKDASVLATTYSVLALLASWRRESRLVLSPGDIYVKGLAFLLGVSSLLSFFVVFSPPANCWIAGCFTPSPLARIGIFFVTLFIPFVFGLFIGPYNASAAEIFILYSAPLSRKLLLAKRRRIHRGVALFFGFVFGFYLVLAAGWSFLFALPLAFGSLLGMVLSELNQLERKTAWQFLRDSRPVLLFLVFVLLFFGYLSYSVISLTWLSSMAIISFAAILVLFSWDANSGLLSASALSKADLTAKSYLGASLSFDLGLVVDLIVSHLRRMRIARPFSLSGMGSYALASTEIKRSLQSDLYVTLLGLVFQLTGLFLVIQYSQYAPAIVPLLFFIGFMFQLGALRRVLLSRAIRRSFPFSSLKIRISFSSTTLLFAVVFTLVFWIISVLHPGVFDFLEVVIAVWLAYASGLRWAASASPDFSSMVVVTELGVLPVGALTQLIRGWDLLALGAFTLYTLAGWPMVIMSFAYILFGVLRD